MQTNLTISDGPYEYPHSITIGCIDGHEVRGGSDVYEWKCSENGTWFDTKTKLLGKVPSCARKIERFIILLLTTIHFCILAKNCKEPAATKDCTSSGTYYQYSGVINYTRPYGYCIDGSNKITCNSDGEWSGPPPTCRSKKILVLNPSYCICIAASVI